MPYRLIEYSDSQTVHKLGGLKTLHRKIQADSVAFRGAYENGQVWTFPVLRAIKWILENCEGRRVYVEDTPTDPELAGVLFGMTKPPAWAKKPFLLKSEYDDETYVLRQDIVDVYTDFERIGLLDELPMKSGDLSRIYSVDQLLPMGLFRWPGLVQVHDSVTGKKPIVPGRLRQWVINDVLQLGFGIPMEGNRTHVLGRPPLQIQATPAGGRLVDLLRTIQGFYVDDAMRLRGHKGMAGETTPRTTKLSAADMFRRRYLEL